MAGGHEGPLFADARAYSRHAAVQRELAIRLMDGLVPQAGDRILDVGCGDGHVTVDLLAHYPQVTVHGIDVSPAMVERARQVAAGTSATFEVADLLSYHASRPYDVVFSSSALHWILPADRAYARLAHLLRPGGRLAVHQGGTGCYRGLHACARAVIRDGSYADLSGWRYPAFYPSAHQLRSLLASVGFVDITIEARQAERPMTAAFIKGFASAGLLPFLHAVPPHRRATFRVEFIRRALRTCPVTYEHRLYAWARTPISGAADR